MNLFWLGKLPEDGCIANGEWKHHSNGTAWSNMGRLVGDKRTLEVWFHRRRQDYDVTLRVVGGFGEGAFQYLAQNADLLTAQAVVYDYLRGNDG